MLFFYVRHGDPIYTPDQLTPLGQRQAEAMGKRLAMFGVDRIYASTSMRAQQTAQPACELLKKEKILLDFCHENHAWREMTRVVNGQRRWLFGDKDLRAVLVSDEMRALGDHWYEHPLFAEYAFRAGMERIDRETDALFASLGFVHNRSTHTYLVTEPPCERVALFAHQGFGSLFLSSLLDIPYPQFCAHYNLQHTGMTVIEFENVDGICVPTVLTMGNDAHLYREGLPLDYEHRIRF